MLCIVFACFITPVFALGSEDQGYYQLLKPTGEASGVKMQFVLQDGQWIMFGKQPQEEDFRPVCVGEGECKLRSASEEEIKSWLPILPANLQKAEISCIVNIAFAFCRADIEAKPHYLWLALVGENTVALALEKEQAPAAK